MHPYFFIEHASHIFFLEITSLKKTNETEPYFSELSMIYYTFSKITANTRIK
jgi:hypothetical protein